jgi:galactokinase
MLQAFYDIFSYEPEVKSTAPGRINPIGEHTDYNDGFVLPGAIDKRVTFVLGKNGQEDLCRVHALDLGETHHFSLKALSPYQEGGWQNYILGVVAELANAGAIMQGFDAIFTGEVPLGAGLSSSAALECALAKGLDHLFEAQLSNIEIAHIAQMAEHRYAGVHCGIMDQFASMMGKKNQVFLLDCRSLEYQHYSIHLGEYELLLLNSCVTHSLASSAYNERRRQCEEGLATIRRQQPEVNSLRDIRPGMLVQYEADMPPLAAKRCRHVLNENKRVQACVDAISFDDMEGMGLLLYQSHDSLSKLYEVSCAELDFLVDFTRALPAVAGARMMGGGFGGCTLNLIKSSEKEQFLAAISQTYRQRFDIDLVPYHIALEDGARAYRIS